MTRYLPLLLLVSLATQLPAQPIPITNPVAGAQVRVGSVCAIAWTSEGLAPGTQLEISITDLSSSFNLVCWYASTGIEMAHE